MPHLHRGRSSTGASGRGRRIVIILMTIFSLLVLFAGIASLAMAVSQQQEAASLAAAPVCAPGQQPASTPCKLDERVTVTDRHTEEAGRSGYVSRVVTVRTPDGTTQTMYSHDLDFGLWDRLRVNQQVTAELWQGNVVRLDDGAGHYLLAGDDPGGSYFAGVLLTALGALMVGFFVRLIWRERRTGFS